MNILAARKLLTLAFLLLFGGAALAKGPMDEINGFWGSCEVKCDLANAYCLNKEGLGAHFFWNEFELSLKVDRAAKPGQDGQITYSARKIVYDDGVYKETSPHYDTKAYKIEKEVIETAGRKRAALIFETPAGKEIRRACIYVKGRDNQRTIDGILNYFAITLNQQRLPEDITAKTVASGIWNVGAVAVPRTVTILGVSGQPHATQADYKVIVDASNLKQYPYYHSDKNAVVIPLSGSSDVGMYLNMAFQNDF